MQMPADARPLPHPRLTLHADVYICIPTEDPLHGFHPSACMSVKIDAFPCMCMQMDDCFNHSLCNSSLYGLYVMVFHRVPSEGGVLV